MQDSGTNAGLRGIDSVDGTVAWASGTGGTVLKTIDGGAHWSKCAVPDGDKDGVTLDFRGAQAWDAQTAIVMASGPGEKSRLYKTVDGCGTWKLMLKNTDPEGFYDAFTFWDVKHGFLLGDPVFRLRIRNEPNPLEYHAGEKAEPFVDRTLKHRRFLTLSTIDGGTNWAYWGSGQLKTWLLMARHLQRATHPLMSRFKRFPTVAQCQSTQQVDHGLELAAKVGRES